MILLCGIPSETPMRLVREALEAQGASYVMLNQRRFADCDIAFEIDNDGVTGTLIVEGDQYALEDLSAVYNRMMDDHNLPELEDEPCNSPLRTYCRSFHDALARWCEVAPSNVVNRVAPTCSNASKTYQAQLIQEHGFLTPETLVTNEPQLVRDFLSQHKRVIYKSISAIRSIVQELKEEDLGRLERIRWCPAQFQAFVDGTNVRVHTVGDEIFATAISTDATDYRYASRQTGTPAELRAVDLDDELAEKCVLLSRALGLPLAGIDLKVTPDDRVYCFEVNPCPAFSYYQRSTGQSISDAIARYLMSGNHSNATGRFDASLEEAAVM